jgi:CRISPR-associated protein Cmr3
LWYLATPGLFGGWKLPDTAGTIVSAAVGNPLAISGWDNARNGPRPTRFAAPAGSVYYIDSPVTESSPRAFGNFTEEGFGLALPGIWKET